ncbi:hypothetical protein NEDG_00283 [Nematocida displodere]|uniref:PIN domain-containing protein n=1 Tax=Nematocida displodere TaxID=1805483 RepID=A0A177EIV3_9MICR|nr:hypothetical protein NEDG_00283 [Nematocida displodere]
MGAFLVGVDTNVLLDTLETLKETTRQMNTIHVAFFIPRMVLRELDALKVNNPSARVALRFLEDESVRPNPKVVLEEAVSSAGQNNDDSIAIACQMNNVTLLLSNDTALRLKVQSLGTPAISTLGKSPDRLFKQIRENLVEIDFMEFQLHDDHVTPAQNIKASIAELIYAEKIHPLLTKELGEEMIPFFVKPEVLTSLDALVRFTVKNYSLFSTMLPRSSKPILTKLAKTAIEHKDIESILYLFGVGVPQWFRGMKF